MWGLCIIDFVLSTTKLKYIHFKIEYIKLYYHMIYSCNIYWGGMEKMEIVLSTWQQLISTYMLKLVLWYWYEHARNTLLLQNTCKFYDIILPILLNNQLGKLSGAHIQIKKPKISPIQTNMIQ
jgi:hypothetical protein